MKKITTILYLVISIVVQGQISEITWQSCFGTLNNNPGNGIVKNENGYLIVTGTNDGEGLPNYHGASDIWLIEIDSLGNKTWENCYGGSGGDGAYKIIKENDNYFILAGTTSTDGDVQSVNNGGIDYWVLKLNKNKEIIWEKCYGTPYNEGPSDMLVAPDGGIIVMGRIFNSGGDVSVYYGSNDVWMFKTDSVGNIEWEKTLGNQWNDNGVSIMLNSENNVVLIGAASYYGGMVECDVNDYVGNVWIVELDLNGNIISQHCYGGSSYDLGFVIRELDDGYIFASGSNSDDGDVTGHHGPGGNPPDAWADIWVVKIDFQGEIIWQKSLGGYDSELPYYINNTEDGGFIVIGKTNSNDGDVSGNHSSGEYDTDIWVVKLDSLGEIEWQQCFGGAGSERLENTHTILKKNDYNYVIISSSDYSPSYDVQCGTINGLERDVWLFELKECAYYAPATPATPCGADTACSAGGAATVYTVAPAQNAWSYEWQLLPETAGTISDDSTTATVNWAENYEGTAVITVRSQNDCGQSEWSEPKYTQVFTCLGTEEIPAETTALRVYPNPAKDYVVFEFDVQSLMFEVKGQTEIKIYDAFGREVSCLPVSRKKTVWKTKNMRSGLYYYKTEINGKALSGKVVIRD